MLYIYGKHRKEERYCDLSEKLLREIDRLVKADSQLIIATHSPFLLAIPAIGGASLLEFTDLYKSGFAGAGNPGLLLLGFAVSAAVGYFALALLLKVLKKGQLIVFSVYLCLAATVVLLKQLCGAA